MTVFPWRVLAALLVLSVLAVVLSLPWPPPSLWIVVAALALAVVAGSGLWLADRGGVGAPLLEAGLYRRPLPRDAVAGMWIGPASGTVLGAGVLVVLRFAVLPLGVPAIRARWVEEAALPLWQRGLIAFNAGVLEEVFFRLLLVSLLVVLARRLGGAERAASPAAWTLWGPIGLVALGFAAAHLPRWLASAPASALLVGTVLVLNGVGGVVFGTLYVRRGLEAAILAHVAADLVLHVLGPAVLLAGSGSG
jgi:hypothetical protein